VNAALACTVATLSALSHSAEIRGFELVSSGNTNTTRVELTNGNVAMSGVGHGTITVTNSSVGAPFENATSLASECVYFVKKSSSSFEIESDCAFTAATGDKMFGVYRRKSGDNAPGTGGEGKFEMLGGTGAYAGVSGTCPYKTTYLPANQVVTIIKCQR
jgi:hypothetical protein